MKILLCIIIGLQLVSYASYSNSVTHSNNYHLLIVENITDATKIRLNLVNNHKTVDPATYPAYFSKLVEINNALNSAWAMGNKKDFSSFLLELWNNSYNELPKESWVEVNSSLVKIEMAKLLQQSANQCLITVNCSNLRNYVLSQLSTSHNMVTLAAIRALGTVGNEDDIVLLGKIVSSEKDGWAETAANSLFMLRYASAIAELEKLSKSVRREKLKNSIINRLSDYNEGYKGRLSSECQ